MGSMGVFFNNGISLLVLGERLTVLTIAWVVWWFPLNTFSQQLFFGQNAVLTLKGSLVGGNKWRGSLLLLFICFIRITFIYYRKFPQHCVSILSLKYPSIIAVSPLLSLNPISPPPSYVLLQMLFPLHYSSLLPKKSAISLFQKFPCISLSQSLPNLLGLQILPWLSFI